jgi:hypothetical protein
MPSIFKKGDRVVPTGKGRTSTWPATPGTVTRKMGASTFEVLWDGTSFGDEMGLDEMKLDELLGAVRFDDQFAQERGIRLYDAKDRNGRPIKVTIPEE